MEGVANWSSLCFLYKPSPQEERQAVKLISHSGQPQKTFSISFYCVRRQWINFPQHWNTPPKLLVVIPKFICLFLKSRRLVQFSNLSPIQVRGAINQKSAADQWKSQVRLLYWPHDAEDPAFLPWPRTEPYLYMEVNKVSGVKKWGQGRNALNLQFFLSKKVSRRRKSLAAKESHSDWSCGYMLIDKL